MCIYLYMLASTSESSSITISNAIKTRLYYLCRRSFTWAFPRAAIRRLKLVHVSFTATISEAFTETSVHIEEVSLHFRSALACFGSKETVV